MNRYEPLKAAIITSLGEIRAFICLFPDITWYYCENLKRFLNVEDQVEVDVLVVDLADRYHLSFEEHEMLKALSRRYPIVALLEPGDPAFWWMEAEGITVLRKPADIPYLAEYLFLQRDRIKAERLRRLFKKVAEAYR